MATQTSEKKATKSGQVGAAEPEHLPCPRCESTNTKFCYYNNYNFSQPRHFCKSCRRYWTHGGALRDIPVGGATRKNAKRIRTSDAPASTAAGTVYSSAYGRDFRHLPAAASQLLSPLAANCGVAMPFVGSGRMGRGFATLFNSAPALGGFASGLDEVGRASWPFAAAVDGGGSNVAGQPWRMEDGENGLVGGGDYCFAFPELAISTPGSFLK